MKCTKNTEYKPPLIPFPCPHPNKETVLKYKRLNRTVLLSHNIFAVYVIFAFQKIRTDITTGVYKASFFQEESFLPVL